MYCLVSFLRKNVLSQYVLCTENRDFLSRISLIMNVCWFQKLIYDTCMFNSFLTCIITNIIELNFGLRDFSINSLKVFEI